jgi:hypothetical protein
MIDTTGYKYTLLPEGIDSSWEWKNNRRKDLVLTSRYISRNLLLTPTSSRSPPKLSAATVRGESLKDVLKREERRTPTVLGFQRGGVITADIVAKKLSCDLDIIIPRKLTDPGNKEHANETLMEDGTTFLDEELANGLYIAKDLLEGLGRP